jgi:hypothetical protein
MAKSIINTPFECRLDEKVPSASGGNPGTYDKHRTPILSKPHSTGKDTIREKFFESGKALEPNPEKFETPFNNTLYTAGSKKQGIAGLHAKND